MLQIVIEVTPNERLFLRARLEKKSLVLMHYANKLSSLIWYELTKKTNFVNNCKNNKYIIFTTNAKAMDIKHNKIHFFQYT